MAALLGKIDPFDPEDEEWPEYIERLGQFFEANGLLGNDDAAKRRTTLISLMKPSTYRLARSLLSPAKPSEKTFDEIVAVLTKHYSPAPSEVMQRYRFNSRSRRSGESVATFAAELHSLAKYCNLGDTLEKMLRDRLVSGINDEGIQKKLLAEHDLTYESALRIAQGLETASKNLHEMRQPQSGTPAKLRAEPVNRVGEKRNWRESGGDVPSVWSSRPPCKPMQVQGGSVPQVQKEGAPSQGLSKPAEFISKANPTSQAP